MRELPRPLAWLTRPFVGHALFWSWNMIFLSFFFLGVFPFVVWYFIIGTLEGVVPWDLTLFSALLLAVPPACMVFAYHFLLREPHKLTRLLFVIEGPILILCLVRIFLVRELTGGVAQVLLTGYAGAFFYLYEMLRGSEERRGPLLVQLCGQTLLLLVGLYAAACLGLYAPPLASAFLKGFFSFEWLSGLGHVLLRNPSVLLFGAMALLLFGYTCLLLIGSPVALAILAVTSFRRVQRAAAQRLGRAVAVVVPLGVSAASLLLAVALHQQPQGPAFRALAEPPQSDAQRRERLAQAPALRAGLVNAYLGSYRYLSAVGEDNGLARLYRDTTPLGGPLGELAQRLHHLVFAPALFWGESQQGDMDKAAGLYESFFDTPIQKGEREAVLHALEATWSQDERQAGLLNQGQRKVWLLRQELKATRRGDAAEVELHEVYQNQTTQPQEVFYYFSLPESAAVTGLWLGASDKRDQADAFKVAPRGAAQRVYQRQVQQRRDPALLEQIGPRQYRLRAFPVPERPTTFKPSARDLLRGEVRSAPPLHLWLTYQVLAQDGAYPLPRLLEKRNVYWTRSSERVVDGRPFRGDDWLPAGLPGAGAAQRHELRLLDGALVVAEPTAGAAPVKGKRLAVVLDRSYSMERVRAEVEAALQRLRAGDNQVDLYLSASQSRGEGPLRVAAGGALPAGATLFYGGGRLREVIDQFLALRGAERYDGVVVLTDDGSLDLARDEARAAGLKAEAAALGPLWIVHLGGRLAPGYDDGTLLLIQRSGGGVSTRLDEALVGIAGAAGAVVRDGYRFQVSAGAAVDAPAAGAAADPLAALLARQAIVARTAAVQRGEAAELDGLHHLAVRYGVVSPYSSMIVLVNEQQRRELEAEEKKQDRFDRRVESGVESLTKSGNPFNTTAAPEPGEWLLLLLGLGGLAYAQRGRAQQAAAVLLSLGLLGGLAQAEPRRHNPCSAVRCAVGTRCVINKAGRPRCLAPKPAPGLEEAPNLDACAQVRCMAGTRCQVVKGLARCEKAAPQGQTPAEPAEGQPGRPPQTQGSAPPLDSEQDVGKAQPAPRPAR